MTTTQATVFHARSLLLWRQQAEERARRAQRNLAAVDARLVELFQFRKGQTESVSFHDGFTTLTIDAGPGGTPVVKVNEAEAQVKVIIPDVCHSTIPHAIQNDVPNASGSASKPKSKSGDLDRDAIYVWRNEPVNNAMPLGGVTTVAVSGLESMFTPHSREVLAAASNWARNWNHSWIGPEHLLAAIASRHWTIISPAMPWSFGSFMESLRTLSPGGQEHPIPLDPIPYTPRARTLLEGAIAECRRLKLKGVFPTHLLWAMTRDRESIAGRLLFDLGVTPEKVQSAPVRHTASLPPEVLARLVPAGERVAELLHAGQSYQTIAGVLGQEFPELTAAGLMVVCVPPGSPSHG